MAHTTAEFDNLVEKLLKQWHVPGVAIAVVNGDEIFAKGYGHAELSSQKKVTADTIFDCASTSKSFTAASVALLVHDDEKYPDIHWTSPVSKFLPEDFVLQDKYSTENITIEDILSHRTGMPRHDESYLGIRSAKPDNAYTITRNLRNLSLHKPLRTEYEYCNIMYTAASYLVEKMSGEPYPEFLKRRLWDPLEMTNTYHDLCEVEARNATDRLSHAYSWNKKKEEYFDIPLYNQPEGQGAGCIYSSVRDYAKWIQAMIKRSGPVPEAAHKELVKPRTICPEDPDTDWPFYSQALYAMGWNVETYRGHKVIGHDGSVPGFSSLMRFLPDHEWGFVVFGNTNYTWDVAETLNKHLMDEVLQVPSQNRIDWMQYHIDWDEKCEAKNKDEDQPFPDRPDPPTPTSTSLENYAGTYSNVGYHEIVIEVKDGKLFADCTDRCYPINIHLDHAFEDKFVAEIRVAWSPDGDPNKVESKFELDEEGQVKSFTIEFEKDIAICFDRVK